MGERLKTQNILHWQDVRKALFPLLELVCALIAAILWYRQGGAVWYSGERESWVPFLIWVLIWPLHWLTARSPKRLSILNVWLGLYVLSGLFSTLIAYEPQRAFAKLGLILGAIGIFYALIHQPTLRHFYIALSAVGFLGLTIALYFLATNDWASGRMKVIFLASLGQHWARFFPKVPGHRLTPNVAGGLLAFLLPLYIPLIAMLNSSSTLQMSAWPRRIVRAFWAVTMGGVILVWILSCSRGAWIAGLSIGLLWGLWHALSKVLPDHYSERAWRSRLLSMVLLSSALLLLAISAGYTLFISDPSLKGALLNRLRLWQQASLLTRDYLFTGVGLGMFEMPFSIYTLLIHVGYIVNSHNLFLDVLIEQGIGGLLILLGIIISAISVAGRAWPYAQKPFQWVIEASLASLGVSVIHGLADDVLYGSRGLLLFFLPIALILASDSFVKEGKWLKQGEEKITHRRVHNHWPVSAIFLVLTVGLIGFGVEKSVIAAWWANLGALEQTRVELNVYDQNHFDNPTLDQVRQREKLDRAVNRFVRALRWDEANPTACQRMAGIALARGDYALALTLMEKAWNAGYRDSVTRLLMGDALIANGQPQAAAEIIKGLPWAQSRLEGQAWSRYAAQRDWQREAYVWQTVLILNPDHAGARQRLIALQENTSH